MKIFLFLLLNLLSFYCSTSSKTVVYTTNDSIDKSIDISFFKVPNKDLFPFLFYSWMNLSNPQEVEKDTQYSIVRVYKKPNISKKYNLWKLGREQIPFRFYPKDYQSALNKELQSIEDLKQGYKDLFLNQKYLKKLSELFPDKTHYITIGKTHLGNDIPGLVITNKKVSNPKVSVLINAAHHGEELISIEYCYQLVYLLLSNSPRYNAYLDTIEFVFVPIVNPDGNYFFWHRSVVMGRKNGFLDPSHPESSLSRGIDLNRNYPFFWNSGQSKASSQDPSSSHFRGYIAGSEPEVQAMIKLADEKRFSYSISFHSIGTCILYPYTIEGLKNPQPDYVQDLAMRMSEVSIALRTRFSRYSAIKNMYPVDGTDQDYYYNQFGTNALLIESSHHNPEYKIAQKAIDAFQESVDLFLDECANSYKFAIQVLENGKPVSAKVVVKGIQYYQNEKRESSPYTGLYIHTTNKEELFSVEVALLNGKKASVSVKSQKKLEPVVVRL